MEKDIFMVQDEKLVPPFREQYIFGTFTPILTVYDSSTTNLYDGTPPWGIGTYCWLNEGQDINHIGIVARGSTSSPTVPYNHRFEKFLSPTCKRSSSRSSSSLRRCSSSFEATAIAATAFFDAASLEYNR